MSAYVPNGRALDHEHYQYKLRWLDRLVGHLDAVADPPAPVALCGDFNIAPTDADVWDITELVDATHVSAPERAALQRLLDWGLTDVFREQYPDAERRLLLVGLPGRQLPQGHRHADRPRPRLGAGRASGCSGRSSTATPARASSPRTTRRSIVELADVRERSRPMSDATPGSPGWAARIQRAVARRSRRPGGSRCSGSPTPSGRCCTAWCSRARPNEVIEAAAADLEAVAERFSGYTNKSMYEGFAESANAGEPFGFFDHSPMLGRANPLAPPIDLWLEGDRMVGTATFGAAYEGPPGLRARRLRRGRLRRGARLDAVAVRAARA